MSIVIAVSNPNDWPLAIPGVEVILARDYLTDPRWSRAKGLRVFNLSRSYQYQSTGYYVSLLAVARGHTPIPSLTTVLDMRSRVLLRAADDELEDLMQHSLRAIKSEKFVLSVYFGRNLARRYDRLARKLFSLFQAPFLRAHFVHDERWRLQSVGLIPAREIPQSHHDFVMQAAKSYLDKPWYHVRASRRPRYALAILHDRDEALPPSNERALRRFERAAAKVGFGVEMIDKDDYSRLPEFDALFLRETTFVNHHTYRFARRAAAEGLAVIDDPQSILRCTNKVYLAERLGLKGVTIPRTVIASRDTADEIGRGVGFPCVLKHPDSAFSQGVLRCDDAGGLGLALERIFAGSDLVVAQEFLPTGFDWRVGVFDRRPLFACRYFMAEGHWQVVHTTGPGHYSYGKVEPVPLERVPRSVLRTAVRAANLIGDGLYGVDLKEVGRRVYVIEVNDNPNIDAGYEDRELGNELYERIVRGLMTRVEALKGNNR